jgi:nucleoside-diphosphate-sugar epimerase
MERVVKLGPLGKLSKPKARALAEAPPFKKAAVLGASGSIGRELVIELMDRGVDTRVVSRNILNLRRNFAEGAVEFHEADLTNPAAMFRACEDCDMVFLCAGVPLEQYEQHIAMGRNLAQAITQTKAKAMLISSYWGYCPIRHLPVREDAPRRGGGRFTKVRQIQEDVLVSAGASVVHLPDIFGPGANYSFVNEGIAALARGKVAPWPGDPTAVRDFLFVPDIRPVLVNLAMKKQAYGQRLNVSGSGAIEPRQLFEMAALRVGERTRVRPAALWMVKLASRFSDKARESFDLYPIYARPAVLDGVQLRAIIGDYRVTPYSLAIDRTLRWMTGGTDVEEAA